MRRRSRTLGLLLCLITLDADIVLRHNHAGHRFKIMFTDVLCHALVSRLSRRPPRNFGCRRLAPADIRTCAGGLRRHIDSAAIDKAIDLPRGGGGGGLFSPAVRRLPIHLETRLRSIPVVLSCWQSFRRRFRPCRDTAEREPSSCRRPSHKPIRVAYQKTT